MTCCGRSGWIVLSPCLLIALCQVHLAVTSGVKKPVCVRIDDCSCRWDNDTVMNLHPVAQTNGQPRYKDKLGFSGEYTYSFNPCVPFTETAAGAVTDSCHNVASCQTSPMTGNKYFYDSGVHSRVHFFTESWNLDKDYVLIMEYHSRDDSAMTVVYTICSPTENFTAMGVMSYGRAAQDQMVIGYILYSPHACPYIETPIGIGTIVCIGFTGLLTGYFVVGVLFMKCVRKQKGIDVIPHVAAWSEGFSLVKEGVLFVRSGFKTTSYESV